MAHRRTSGMPDADHSLTITRERTVSTFQHDSLPVVFQEDTAAADMADDDHQDAVADNPQTPLTHGLRVQRGYVACDSCRARKVRCTLEGEPPCAKCRREHRVCRFDRYPKNKIKKHREPPRWANRHGHGHGHGNGHGLGASRDEPIEAAPSPESATSLRQSETQQDLQGVLRRDGLHGPSLSQTSSHGLISSSIQSNASHSGETPSTMLSNDWQESSIENTTPRTTNTSLSDRVVSTIFTGSNDALNMLSDAATAQHHTGAAPMSAPSWAEAPPVESSRATFDAPVAAPTEGQSGMGFRILTLSEPSEETLDLWDKSRFVRQGVFTGQEAVTYLDLFFKHLSPLSPVLLEQFSLHSAHARLITEESMLCCMLLCISSRFFMLPGAGGASRSHWIHGRLWHYAEFLIKRVIFGQEKLSTAKTRNLGTIESLILISEWHPRALHFPPESEGWDALLVSTDGDVCSDRTRRNNEEPSARWRHDVFEPAKRANRMSWMVLGIATSLAHELGVFSNGKPDAPPSTSTVTFSDEACRRRRLQKLLYTHVTSTATRLGHQSILSDDVAVETMRPSSSGEAAGPSQSIWNEYMSASVELTRLSRLASSMFFVSPSHLERQLQNDTYVNLLEHFVDSLDNWRRTFDRTCEDVSPALKTTILIEYHHLKALAGSISVQAVVQRASMLPASRRNRRDSLAAFLTTRDAKFVRDVVSDSSRVLQLATMTDFKSQLPLAPARTRISVISASLFLLKAISVGAEDTDAAAALDTLEQSTKVLKNSPPDDMDFAMRYASLIDKFTDTFRATLFTSAGHHHHHQHPAGHGGEGHYLDAASIGASEVDATGTTGGSAGVEFEEAAASFQNEFWGHGTMPLDSSIAPFGAGSDQLSQGLDVDSLNFLWNMPDIMG